MTDTPLATYLGSLAAGTAIAPNLPPDYTYGIVSGVSKKYARTDIFNVKDFGAVGDGSHDDTANIQAAMDAAWLAGTTSSGNAKGAIVYFPPGTYVASASLTNASSGNGKIRLVGAGKYCTTIYGTVTGYTIDNPDQGGTDISSIEQLRIVNTTLAAGSGAVRLVFTYNALIDNCMLQGYVGLQMSNNAFNSLISNCTVSAPFDNQLPGTVGIYTAQNTLSCTYVTGYDRGIVVGGSTDLGAAAGGAGCAIIGCRTEACGTGIFLGENELGNLAGSGGAISAFTTERCGTAIYAYYVPYGLTISGSTLTGTIGPGKVISTTTWSGGNATVTIAGGTGAHLDDYGWTSSTRQINIQANSVSGYNTGDGVFVTATRDSSTQFHYTVANPGSSGSGGFWSFQPQYGIRLGTASAVNVSGTTSQPLAEVARIGLADFNGTQANFTAVQTADSTKWVMPAGAKKAAVSFTSCDNPAPGMVFGDLPGQATVTLTTAIEGMEYDITDGQKSGTGTALFGDIVVGGAAQHIKVRYNGTNWTRCG